jgi:hypothetical protein
VGQKEQFVNELMNLHNASDEALTQNKKHLKCFRQTEECVEFILIVGVK